MQIKDRIYAMYKGEELLATGTPQEIADELGIKLDSVKFYLYPSFLNRQAKHKEQKGGRKALVELEGDEE